MPGFFYFLPSARPSDIPAGLSKWGLAYLVDGEDASRRILHRQCRGPQGIDGLIVGSAANWQPEEVKNGDHIEWVKFPKAFAECQAWLGWLKGQPMPGPDDLARAKQISGELHSLADGNRWLIPIAKQYVDGADGAGFRSNLPMSFGLDEETGDWILDSVVPQYRAIWKHASDYLASMMEGFANPDEEGNVTWTIPDDERLVVDAIQVNYRVSARELATLGVLVSGISRLVADTLIDSSGMMQLKKKAVADTGLG